jgi:hypothetical protein
MGSGAVLKKLEVVLQEFREVHGDTYDYSKVVYRGGDHKVIVICPIRGEFSIIPYQHLQGFGFPKLNKTRTTSSLIKEFITVHGNTFDYSKVDYKKAGGKLIIGCKIHGDFSTTLYHHLSGSGCAHCSGSKRVNRITTESIVQDFIKVNGNRYDYSKVDYKGIDTKITICCKLHGDYEQTPYCHKIGRGCPTCGISSISNPKTTEKFIQDAIDLHGTRYDYSKTIYVNCKTKITIVCPVHGDFLQTPANHLNCRGCQKCARRGFRPDKPSMFYVLKCGDITKVGITNGTASFRANYISRKSRMDFSVIDNYCMSGENCMMVEKVVLEYLRSTHDSVTEKFHGYTECFYNVCDDNLRACICSIIDKEI